MPLNRTILVVDDDRDLTDALAAGLEASGYAVVTANSADRALATLQGDEKIDLLLTDLALPGKDGIEFLHEVRNNRKLRDLPVVVLSGFADVRLRELIQLAPYQIVKKPLELKGLVSIIANALWRPDWQSHP